MITRRRAELITANHVRLALARNDYGALESLVPYVFRHCYCHV